MSWNGFADTDSAGIEPGDDFEFLASIGRQFSLTDNVSITPLVELAYAHTGISRRSGNSLSNTGEQVISAAPGVKLTVSSFILELLLRFPLSQDQHGNQLEQAPSFIVGTRLMF